MSGADNIWQRDSSRPGLGDSATSPA